LLFPEHEDAVTDDTQTDEEKPLVALLMHNKEQKSCSKTA
jgi:hypothetical protein